MDGIVPDLNDILMTRAITPGEANRRGGWSPFEVMDASGHRHARVVEFP